VAPAGGLTIARRKESGGVFPRLRHAVGMLLSREIAVLTNAVAFNFLLCLFPLLLVVAFASEQLPFGRRASAGLLVLLQELIPFNRQAVAESVRGLTRFSRGFEIVSLLLIVWGSSGIFIPLEMALNRAWGGKAPRSFWKSRLIAFLMTLFGGLLALLSVALTVAARSYSRDWPLAAEYAVKGTAVLLTVFLFFAIYRVIPDAPVGTRAALQAALWAGGAWEAAKYVFVSRLPAMRLEALYGPLAFAVALVLWAYVTSLIVVFGALMSTAGPGRPGDRAGP
jgi:membrane protein/epoxyqueuosine reductase